MELKMLDRFRTYQLAKALYQLTKSVELPYSLKDQLHRAAQSVVLNLAEGSARPSTKDRKRFYMIALGSLREVQAVIEMEDLKALHHAADQVGASLYRLTRA